MSMTDGTSSPQEQVAAALTAANEGTSEGSGPAVQPIEPAQPVQQTPEAPAQQSGVNPAWDALRSELGETGFKVVEPHLRKWDQEAQDRITRTNSDLERYTKLGEFDQLQAATSLLQRIDQDPKAFYDAYGELLRSQGILDTDPQTPVDGQEEPPAEDDPLAQRLKALEEAEQQRVQQVAEQQFSSEIDTEMSSIREKNPWMTDIDRGEIMERAGKYVTPTATVPDILAKATAEWTDVRTKILNTPRAGDSAPRLVPAGGGNPAATQPVNMANMNRSDREKFVTAYLKANQQ